MTRTLAILLLFLLTSQSFAELKAGAAKIDITPPIGIPMWGYASRRDKPAVGIQDRLHARALTLTLDEKTIALVSLDLGRAPTRDSMQRIRLAVKKIGVDHLFVTGSHTHHGPALELDKVPRGKKPYVRELEEKLIQIITQAVKMRKSAKLAVTSEKVAFNRNRHSRRKVKPLDNELLILRVEDEDGEPIAHAVNFAAHPTFHSSRLLKWSADWPGAMAAIVERKTDAPCLFLQGFAGDLSPNPGRLQGPVEFGEALAKKVLTLSDKAKPFPFLRERLQVKEDEFRFRCRVDLKNRAIRTLMGLAFFPELVAFYEREYREGVRPHLTTGLIGEDLGIVGISGEVFCGHSLSLKRRARLKHLLVLGYCNDYQQYFPTIEAAAEGGYGADPPVSAAEVGAGEKMVDQALIHLYKMRGRLKDFTSRRGKVKK